MLKAKPLIPTPFLSINLFFLSNRQLVFLFICFGTRPLTTCLQELPPLVIAETETKTIIQYETLPPQTVTVPPPANTRRAAFPTPDVVSSAFSTAIPRTTAVTIEEEIIKEPLRAEEIDEYEVEEYEDDDGPRVAVKRKPRQSRRPSSRGWLW
ncbi:hypothetical protein PISMIDRAFT_136220 [Pisolithus microcarpus 441]|uniref:Uncharacterized protein n=1 Tax=Pisolithus microcarpus 441 TaxID=765257 RepID=A0A0C9Z101_9AGAM|nr:hypothetical protein PISMIDRAFT_136220 [Pisolithus microcarpus 441]